jgi:tyrosine-protein kinase Etk/Wzc
VIRFADNRRALAGDLDNVSTNLSGSWTDPILSQIEVLKSRAVASEVVKREPLGLRVLPMGFPAAALTEVRMVSQPRVDTVHLTFAEDGVLARSEGIQVRAPYGSPVEVGGIRFAITGKPSVQSGYLLLRSEEEAINTLVGSIAASARKWTDVIDVEYTAHDPEIARYVVNTTVEAFQALNAEKAQEQSRRRRLFLEEQLSQTDAMLAQAQSALSDFRSREEVYGSEERISAEASGILGLDVRREEMDADRKAYVSLLAGLNRATSQSETRGLRAIVSSPGIAANPVISQLYGQLVQYQTVRDTMVTGPWGSATTNPDVQRVDTLIRATQEKLVSAIESHLTSLEARIAALDDLKERNAAALQQLPRTQAAEARLIQQVEISSRMATQLREEYQRARMAEAVEAGEVEILDRAVRAGLIDEGAPIKIAIGIFVGLLFGGSAAFLLEHLNTAIRRREDIEGVLQVPGLAVIPQISGNGVTSRFRILGRRNGKGRGHALITVSNARSSEAEAYRTLRTNLIFSQAIQSLRTVVVTSPSPKDGKTTTAANLAVTFAHQGIRVLLMDCDLRKSRLHALFGLSREPGLSQVILGESSIREAVRQSSVDGLSLITSGVLPPNPSELLGSTRLREMVAQFATEYDIVIMDSPPIYVAADAQILSALADGVVLVLRAGQTQRQSAQESVSRLANVGARVVGAVLNDPDHKVPAYGGYYYYNYYGSE